MFRSVKSQIVAATSLIILVILGATTYFVIDEKTKELSHDIFVKTVSFAELTHERIVRNYENNYVPQAFANFNREMSEIYGLNPDVTGMSIYNYKGETLYQGNILGQPAEEAQSAISEDDLERVQAIWPSFVIKESERTVYLEKEEQGLRYANFNGRDADAIGDAEQIADIIYPFRDPNNITRTYSIRYNVSYAALGQRIRSTAFNIGFLALLGVAIALFIGGLVAGRITSPIRALSEGAVKIGHGDLKTRISVHSKNEIGLLADTFNKMATDLEKSTKVLVEKEKLTHELELAGEIQRELLPKTLPVIKSLDLAASLYSATEVGGDCYDFIGLEKNQWLFYVADVTGHGVPAGLVAAINNALVPALVEYDPSPQALVVHLNKILKMKTRPNVFMTMVMALWDENKHELSYTQAGHDPILHYQAKTHEVRQLETGGMALGMVPDLSKLTKTEIVKVAPDDVLVFYTDGIPEAWKNEKETYGMDRFKESIARHAKLKTAQGIHDALLKDVRDFMGKYPQQDDITLIVAKRI
ncbi:MAG: SpoIIE family protein phosphatase [Candidatus Peregrinibacteria bacterium]